MAQWGLGETRYLKARKSTGSDLEEALSPISTTITSTSNDTNATQDVGGVLLGLPPRDVAAVVGGLAARRRRGVRRRRDPSPVPSRFSPVDSL